ncbi:hypothetical protein ADUPG1_005782, partial [Aduncisulcus paluster]
DNGDGTSACLCDLGWELGLTDCTSPTCDPICVNGTCISSSIDGKANVCECDAGYTGDDCNTVACIDMEAGHGICVNDVIYCSAGWGGDTCSDPVCTPECGHGSCQNEGAGAYCECDDLWDDGFNCDVPQCEGDCGDWTCVLSDELLDTHVCKCVLGYSVDPLSGD